MNTDITIGSSVMVKVGAREIDATVLEIADGTYIVQSKASGKVFNTSRIVTVEQQTAEPEATAEEAAQEVTVEETTLEATTEKAETPNPAPESQPVEKPKKKLSLMDAAVEVLKAASEPMNTRQIVQAAIEQGFWIPTACKTPEQTLYGSIFREMATKENPRIVKSEQKGKFILADQSVCSMQ